MSEMHEQTARELVLLHVKGSRTAKQNTCVHTGLLVCLWWICSLMSQLFLIYECTLLSPSLTHFLVLVQSFIVALKLLFCAVYSSYLSSHTVSACRPTAAQRTVKQSLYTLTSNTHIHLQKGGCNPMLLNV